MKPNLTLVAMVVAPTALVLAALWIRDLRADRADARRRAEQDRAVDAAWFAELAAMETTPVLDQLMCEQIEKAEGWTS
jgi:hypothetical protein